MNHRLKDAAVPGTSRLMKTTNKVTVWLCLLSLTTKKFKYHPLYTVTLTKLLSVVFCMVALLFQPKVNLSTQIIKHGVCFSFCVLLST